MNIAVTIIFLVILIITVLMCNQESKLRKISFVAAFLICLITTPLIGYILISGFPLRNPPGCNWCGNTKNEAEYCNVCGKNVEGLTRDEVELKAT